MNAIEVIRMKEDKVVAILTIILLVILMVVMASSCTKEQEPAESMKMPLQLSGNTTLLPVIVTRSGQMTVTRGSSSQAVDLPALTPTGVYAMEMNPNILTVSTTSLRNVQYTATGSNGAFTSVSPIILEYRKSYKVCAYAPYQSTVTDPTVVGFSHGMDVLYALQTNVNVTGSTATASLQFVHKVAQIQFSLVAGSGSPDLTGVKLSVTGFKDSCTLNLTDGTLTPITGKGATVTLQDKVVCFIPDSQPMTLNVMVMTKDGKEYLGAITRTFAASNSYNYTLTVNRNLAELDVNSQIVDWLPVDAGNISVLR